MGAQLPRMNSDIKSHLSININGDEPIQPTSWPDVIALIYVCIGIVILFSGNIVVIKNRKYLPIRARNVPLLAIMGISGIIHIVSALIANNQFSVLSYLEHLSCIFWNYWMQYFLGLCVWFIGICMRLITYGSVFSRRLTNKGAERVIKYKWISGLILSSPLFALFILLTVTRGSYYDPNISQCHSLLVFKIGLTLWIIMASITLIVYAIFVKRDITSDYYNEFMPLGQIITLGLVILVINGFIIFLGLLSSSYFRSFATINVVHLHLFSFLRLAGIPIYKSLKSDEVYSDEFIKSQKTFKVELQFVEEFKNLKKELIDDFLDYCAEQPQFNLNNKGAKGLVKPEDLVDCYKAIQNWKLNFERLSTEGGHELTQKHIDLVDKYLTVNGKSYIRETWELGQSAMNHKTKWAFDQVEKWIFNEILDKEFGTNYLQRDIVSRRIYTDEIRELFDLSKQNKAMSRLGKAQLTDYTSLCSIVMGNDTENSNSTELVELELEKEDSDNLCDKHGINLPPFIIEEENSD